MRYDEESENAAVDATAPPDQQPTEGVDMATSKSSKSPAFQFYPRDFLSSRKVDRMSMTERGIYITLLAHCWIDRGLPTDMSELAYACRMKADKFERIWTRGVLHQCFELRNDRFVNPRLEVERKVQIDYSRKQKEKADKRWSVDAVALPHPASGNGSIPSLPIPSHSIPSRSKKEDSSEPPSVSSPAVLTFPTIGKGPKFWALTEAQVVDWAGAYPGLDVRVQCERALRWVNANGCKTAKGMPAFLVRWLNNATDRGGSRPVHAATGTTGRGRTGAPPPGKYDGIEES